jgi:hypothetical protein
LNSNKLFLILGPSGLLIQQHHYQATLSSTISNVSSSPGSENVKRNPTITLTPASKLPQIECMIDKFFMYKCFDGYNFCFIILVLKFKPRPSILTLPGGPLSQSTNKKSLILLWGATGEQEWTPALTTGNKVLTFFFKLKISIY